MSLTLLTLAALSQATPDSTVPAPAHPDPTRTLGSAAFTPDHASTIGGSGAMPGLVQGVSATVTLGETTVRTSLGVALGPHLGVPGEAELLVTLPEGATDVALTWSKDGQSRDVHFALLDGRTTHALGERHALLTGRTELLEYAGQRLLRSADLDPGLAGGVLTASYVAPVQAAPGRRDVTLPRSVTTAGSPPWTVEILVPESSALAALYSPTHELEEAGAEGEHVRYRVKPLLGAGTQIATGPLRLSAIEAATDGPVTTSVFTAADAEGAGGWFMLFTRVSEEAVAAGGAELREVTLVLDRSGSMAGEKFEQAVAAARQIIAGLAPGERIQIIDYANDVRRFAEAPVEKTPESAARLLGYLDGLLAKGGTNLDEALRTALSQPAPGAGVLPVVLFLTDGLPTKGEQREHVIRENAERANEVARRVFTFGVGNDVNAPLLDAIASGSRARPTYVRPGENVEVAVGSVFERLDGPVMVGVGMAFADGEGGALGRTITSVYPQVMPDLYAGDELLVVGRFERPVNATATLLVDGEPTLGVPLDCRTAEASSREFVRRLWAMRHVSALEAELRNRTTADPSQLAGLRDDPEFKETIDAIVDVAVEHGVLTDTTRYLAQQSTFQQAEGTLQARGPVSFPPQQLANIARDSAGPVPAHQEGLSAYDSNLANNGVRSGSFGVAQQLNITGNASQRWVNGDNLYCDSMGNYAVMNTVRMVGRRAYFARRDSAGGQVWTDGRLLLAAPEDAPRRHVEFGSLAWSTLLDRLRGEGRLGELALGPRMALNLDGEVVTVGPPLAPAPAAAPATAGGQRNPW